MNYIKKLNLIAVILLLVPLGIIYLYLVYPNDTYGWITDSAWYLLMADYYSNSGEINIFLTYIGENNRFPPLYPWILGLFGAGSDNIHAAHMVTAVLMGGVFILYFCWLRNQNQTLLFSLFLTTIFAALPITLFHAMYVMSEALFILLIFTVFIAIDKSKDSVQYLYVAAITIGLSMMTRGIGIVLLPAFIFYLFRHKCNNITVLIIISMAPIIGWTIHQSFTANRTNYFLGYLTYIENESIDVVISELLNNVRLIGTYLVKCFDYSLSVHSKYIVTFVSILSVFGLAGRLRANKFDAYYYIFYLAIVIVWPASSQIQRFLFVILPLFLFYGLHGVSYITDRINKIKSVRLLPYVYCLVILLVMAPTTAITIKRLNVKPADEDIIAYTRTPSWLLETFQHNAELNSKITLYYIAAAEEIAKYVPEDQCVYSVWSELVMLYSKRISIKPPLDSVSDEAFEKMTNECQYHFMIGTGTNPILYSPFYPLERIKSKMTPLFMTNYEDKDGNRSVITILSRL